MILNKMMLNINVLALERCTVYLDKLIEMMLSHIMRTDSKDIKIK